MYIPERGDIFHLAFDPAAGTEMKGGHYAIALSPRAYNRATGLVYACPISQGRAAAARSGGMISTLLGAGTATQGNVHCHRMKALDWKIRRAAFRETVPDYVGATPHTRQTASTSCETPCLC